MGTQAARPGTHIRSFLHIVYVCVRVLVCARVCSRVCVILAMAEKLLAMQSPSPGAGPRWTFLDCLCWVWGHACFQGSQPRPRQPEGPGAAHRSRAGALPAWAGGEAARR